jgi:hypothetical protein
MLTTRAGLFVLIACTMQTVGNAEASSAVDTVSSTPPLRISRIRGPAKPTSTVIG